ncbi:lamin-like protein [Ricinus communis]|uniref:lamin-like protein n=1 Tax=Ricinus communis TaxID=3988 RepID=UPI00201AF8A8|nr:lamin-like protein [Ricinus communis]
MKLRMEYQVLRKIVILSLVVVAVMMIMKGVKGEVYYVGGGKQAWHPNLNFSDWSSRHHFYVGDWLFFGFDKRMHNVLEVNKTSYENCNDVGFIKNFTRGGRDVVKLTEPKTYYFLSSGGYCFGGMKVAVNVDNISPTSPPASSLNFASPSKYFCGQIVMPVTFVSVLLGCIFFF